MKKNLFDRILSAGLALFVTAVCFLATGCTSKINIMLNKDGSIDVQFSGTSGLAFETLIKTASGVKDGEVVFNTNEIEYELGKNGFSNVRVSSKAGTDLNISMSDKTKQSSLYKSDVLKSDKTSITATLSAKKLLDFYNSSDEEIVSFLDLLLAPVFNDEVLSESEYIETIAAFYGQGAADEIAESSFDVTLSTPDGKSSSHIIPLVKLLTLNETLTLK